MGVYRLGFYWRAQSAMFDEEKLEPSQPAAFVLGILELTGLAFKARKRQTLA